MDRQTKSPIEELTPELTPLLVELKHGQMEPFSLGELENVCDAILGSSQSHPRGAPISRGVYSGYSLRRWAGYSAVAMASLIVVIFGASRVSSLLDKPSSGPASYTYKTSPAQRAKLQLADGTEMLLAPSTTAKVTGRTVELTGAALFTVTHNNGQPFTVYTSGIATRVLGTSFSVRRYSNDTSVQVVVAQGRVSLANTVLNTGDMGAANTAGKVSVTHDVNVATALAWADGKLVFNNTLLRDAIPELERWYGVVVKADDQKLLSREITTVLSAESTSEAVSLLAQVLEAHGELRGSTVTFSAR